MVDPPSQETSEKVRCPFFWHSHTSPVRSFRGSVTITIVGWATVFVEGLILACAILGLSPELEIAAAAIAATINSAPPRIQGSKSRSASSVMDERVHNLPIDTVFEI
jgi:hypothetical protein